MLCFLFGHGGHLGTNERAGLARGEDGLFRGGGARYESNAFSLLGLDGTGPEGDGRESRALRIETVSRTSREVDCVSRRVLAAAIVPFVRDERPR